MNVDKLDQEIQNALDNKLEKESTSEEVKAYISLYEVLDNSPTEDYLPNTFADKVIGKIKQKSIRKDSEEFWWLSSMIVFMLLTGVLMLVLLLGVMEIDAIDFISKYLPMMILITVVIGGVQWLDNRLVKLHL